MADAAGNRIRKIDIKGNVTTLIGTGTSGYNDGDISIATLANPTDLRFDSNGDLIITTTLGVRKLNLTTGQLSTLVGGSSATPFNDGAMNIAGFAALQGLLVDDNDIFYLVDRHAIRYLASDGSVTTLAGSSTQGVQNGAPLSSRFFFPNGLVQDSGGDFLLADKASHTIRRVFTSDPPIITIGTNESTSINASSFQISFIINESISDFASTDVTVTNGSLSGFAGSGTKYKATITPAARSEERREGKA